MPGGQGQLEAALSHLAAGRAAQARAILLRLKPDDAVRTALARVAAASGQTDQARHLAAGVAAATRDAAVLADLAELHESLGDDAVFFDLCARAISLDPEQPKAVPLLIRRLRRYSQATESLPHWRRAVEISGNALRVLIPYATKLLILARSEEAVPLLRAALDARGFGDATLAKQASFTELIAASALANLMNYLPEPDHDAARREHERYGRMLRALVRTPRPAPASALPIHGRPIRLGIVSSDLRTHSVAFFLAALFEHHDPRELEIHVFFMSENEDGMSGRLKKRAKSWRQAHRLNDPQLAEALRAAKLDAVMELAGHTGNHALAAFTDPPAPVTITYCGYPGTTGVPGIGVRLVDSHTDPRTPEVDARCTERLVRLDPCFLCYTPPSDVGVSAEADPSPDRAPAIVPRAETGGVVFGSFNNFMKMNIRVLRLWARVLRETPNSRLLLKAAMFADKGSRQRILDAMAGENIAADRIELIERTASFTDHMNLYNRVDVALDSFPYAGTTTTCEALWMGVPAVTLAGRADAGETPPHAQRVGLSLLTAAGLPDLAARDEDEYVRIAASLAGDHSRRAHLRASLRDTLRSSVLCDAPAFCRRFERAVRELVEAASKP